MTLSNSRSAEVMKMTATSVTLINVNQTTRRYNPESCHLHARRRENMDYHAEVMFRGSNTIEY
jgi:hypothetical protein